MYGSMVFTAVWTSIPYNVYLYSDGSLYSTLTTTYGSSVSLPAPTRTNYSFNGWSNGGSTYYNSIMVYSNITLTALWTRTAYTISLYSGGSLQRTLSCAPGGSCSLGGSYVSSYPYSQEASQSTVYTSLSNVNSDYTLYECRQKYIIRNLIYNSTSTEGTFVTIGMASDYETLPPLVSYSSVPSNSIHSAFIIIAPPYVGINFSITNEAHIYASEHNTSITSTFVIEDTKTPYIVTI